MNEKNPKLNQIYVQKMANGYGLKDGCIPIGISGKKHSPEWVKHVFSQDEDSVVFLSIKLYPKGNHFATGANFLTIHEDNIASVLYNSDTLEFSDKIQMFVPRNSNKKRFSLVAKETAESFSESFPTYDQVFREALEEFGIEILVDDISDLIPAYPKKK